MSEQVTISSPDLFCDTSPVSSECFLSRGVSRRSQVDWNYAFEPISRRLALSFGEKRLDGQRWSDSGSRLCHILGMPLTWLGVTPHHILDVLEVVAALPEVLLCPSIAQRILGKDWIGAVLGWARHDIIPVRVVGSVIKDPVIGDPDGLDGAIHSVHGT